MTETNPTSEAPESRWNKELLRWLPFPAAVGAAVLIAYFNGRHALPPTIACGTPRHAVGELETAAPGLHIEILQREAVVSCQEIENFLHNRPKEKIWIDVVSRENESQIKAELNLSAGGGIGAAHVKAANNGDRIIPLPPDTNGETEILIRRSTFTWDDEDKQFKETRFPIKRHLVQPGF